MTSSSGSSSALPCWRGGGISIVSQDAPRADAATGARSRTNQAIERLATQDRVRHVRRDLLVLADAAGLFEATPAQLINVVAPDPYLITGGAALALQGLVDEHFFRLTVLVPRPLRSFSYEGQEAQFLVVAATRSGLRRRGIPTCVHATRLPSERCSTFSATHGMASRSRKRRSRWSGCLLATHPSSTGWQGPSDATAPARPHGGSVSWSSASPVPMPRRHSDDCSDRPARRSRCGPGVRRMVPSTVAGWFA